MLSTGEVQPDTGQPVHPLGTAESPGKARTVAEEGGWMLLSAFASPN